MFTNRQMQKPIVYMHSGTVFSYKESQRIFRKMDGARDYYVKCNKSDSKRQTPHVSFHCDSLDFVFHIYTGKHRS